MVTKILIVLIVAAVIVGGALLASHFGLWPFGRGSGDGDGDGTVVSPVNNQEDVQEVEVSELPQSLLIEIREESIIYDNAEISLDDLETILQRYEGVDHAWTLQDTYRADKSTYDSVKNLLEKYDMVFRER
jgi:hypothetical protein